MTTRLFVSLVPFLLPSARHSAERDTLTRTHMSHRESHHPRQSPSSPSKADPARLAFSSFLCFSSPRVVFFFF
ncbi:hypothetical protein BKA56DRAFT_576846, partial [Ilyonectria sp. MPI-CAGE-AT-0026]